MTVEELIGELQKYPKNAKVDLEVFGYVRNVVSVDYFPAYDKFQESVLINSEGLLDV